MVFRNWEILRIEDLWFCKCEQIEVMNYIGKLYVTQKQLSLQCTYMYEGAFCTEKDML